MINERLKNIRRIIAVSSGKGGVGKSLTAVSLSIALAKQKHKVGLFDLDFTSPSTDIILGTGDAAPKEGKGIIAPTISGLKYMSITYYSRNSPTPLRGEDISNVLIELLSVTRWGTLDFLFLDMPPGISDTTLDLIRLINRISFITVTTSSKLAFETMRKLTELLKQLKIPIIGVLENMKMDRSSFIHKEVDGLGLRFLGEIQYDSSIEAALGNPSKLLSSQFGIKMQEIAKKI